MWPGWWRLLKRSVWDKHLTLKADDDTRSE